MDYRFDEKARYSKTHEWVRRDGAEAVIGISDYAQNKLSDVVFVELPAQGKELAREALHGHRVGEGRGGGVRAGVRTGQHAQREAGEERRSW